MQENENQTKCHKSLKQHPLQAPFSTMLSSHPEENPTRIEESKGGEGMWWLELGQGEAHSVRVFKWKGLTCYWVMKSVK